MRKLTPQDFGIIPGPGSRYFTLEHLNECLVRTEAKFERLRLDVKGSGELDKLASAYLIFLEGVLVQTKVLEKQSSIFFHIQKLLLDRNERAVIEAEAAAVLGCVLSHKGDIRQAPWLRTIADVLNRGNFWCPGTAHQPAHPYGTDAIRKWHRACEKQEHLESSHYWCLMEWWYKIDGYVVEDAIKRLTFVVQEGRW